MLLGGGALGDVRIVSAATLERFTRYDDPAFSNRALGWQKTSPRAPMEARFTAPAPAWGGTSLTQAAYGHTGFTGTSIAVDPALDIYIILLTNRVNPTRNNSRIGGVRSALTDAVVKALQSGTPR
jgi:CubicO group peptidase (beta-lactamase class C family)